MSAAMGVAERLLALESAVAELRQLVEGAVAAAPKPPRTRVRDVPGSAQGGEGLTSLGAPSQGRG
jgi:hypothetical protein